MNIREEYLEHDSAKYIHTLIDKIMDQEQMKEMKEMMEKKMWDDEIPLTPDDIGMLGDER